MSLAAIPFKHAYLYQCLKTQKLNTFFSIQDQPNQNMKPMPWTKQKHIQTQIQLNWSPNSQNFRANKMSYFKFGMCIKLRFMQRRDANSHSGNVSWGNGWWIK